MQIINSGNSHAAEDSVVFVAAVPSDLCGGGNNWKLDIEGDEKGHY